MQGIFALGFLLGFQHALEADHLAAVASLATGSKGLRGAVRNGMFWGLGHTLTLLLFGGAALVAGRLVPDQFAAALEFAVGLMLLALGLDVLWRLRRQRVHIHRHRHGRREHFHAHVHPAGQTHAALPHEHRHPQKFPLRAFAVGMMHGMAGSAAIVVLTLKTVHSPAEGLLYILLFGLGSVLGMAILSTVIGLPLRWTAKSLSRAFRGVNACVGLATVGLGLYVMYAAGLAI